MENPEEVKKVEEAKAPEFIETQAEQKPVAEKTSDDAPVLSERDKARIAIETSIIGEPTPLPPVETEVTEKKEEAHLETKEADSSEEDRLKAKIQKRIGKEVSKRKSLEEQLAERDAEIERLKSGKPSEIKADEKREPTSQEIASALKKAREDGDTEFEVQILEYVAEREAKKQRKEAEKSFVENNSKATERAKKWAEVVQDYTPISDDGKEDRESPLNLNNMNSQLYKTAHALYLDPELKRDRYSNGSEAENLRRAVSDAYVELTRMGVGKGKETQTTSSTTKERMKNAMVEPGAAKEEATETTGGPSKPKSDQDNVADEIATRIKFKRQRETALI